jgi:hypothetical protein
MASTVLAMKSRRWLALRALAASIRRGIISGEGRISLSPEALGAETSRYRAVFSFPVPKLIVPLFGSLDVLEVVA